METGYVRGKSVVYCLETDGFVWYVGGTKRPEQREMWHMRRYGPHGAADIPPDYEFKFTILEVCEHDKLRERERYYYDTLHPILNVNLPLLTPDEYRERKRQRYTPKNGRYNVARDRLKTQTQPPASGQN